MIYWLDELNRGLEIQYKFVEGKKKKIKLTKGSKIEIFVSCHSSDSCLPSTMLVVPKIKQTFVELAP